eukprot:5662504-Lingulodinium_polyedra.AAC.1
MWRGHRDETEKPVIVQSEANMSYTETALFFSVLELGGRPGKAAIYFSRKAVAQYEVAKRTNVSGAQAWVRLSRVASVRRGAVAQSG